MNKPKTVRQILNMAKTTLYLRKPDYNRACAFTLFAKQLEKKAKDEGSFFQIKTTHVVKMQCRCIDPGNFYDWPKADPTTEVKALQFLGFAYKDETFYMQFDDNPFFEAYMKRYSETTHHEAYRNPELHEIETGHIRIFNDIEIDVLWKYNGRRNINILTKHLWEKFNELQAQPKKNFWKSKKKDLTQTVYTT